MFPDSPVRKQAYLDYKIRILPCRPMILVKNYNFFSFIHFKQNRPWNNLFWPSALKTSLPRLKNKDFTKLPYGHFLKGLTHDFTQKLKFFS